MRFLVIALLPFIVGIAFYLYFFLRRTLSAFGIDTKKRAVKYSLMAASILLAMCSALGEGFGLVIYLHLMFLSLLLRLVQFVIRKTLGRKRTLCLWQKIYRSGAIPLVLTACILFGGYLNLHSVSMTRYTVYTDKDIRQEGYRVALIADVHFGVSLDQAELQEKCEEISRQDPDIVILCGDIVDHSTTREGMYQVFSILGGIESKLGIYYVNGNHDRSMRMVDNAFGEEELTEAILSSGITILQDDVLHLTEDLVLVGREDRSRDDRAPLASLLEKVKKEDFILTLDHQPNEYKENGQLGTDLLLSGHTHAGQLFPINYLQELIPFNDGVYGMYDIGEKGKAIITSGFGTWSYPSKTAGPAEYVIIDILKK